MTEFTLRPLLYDDLEWLRCLRNANRQAFFNTTEITPEQQLTWWVGHDKLVGDQHWVIDIGSKPAGYFAFVRPNPVLPIFATTPLKGHVKYLNSLLLEPTYHRQGIMSAAISTKMADTISYCGYVRASNIPSLNTCLKVGMRHMGLFEHDDYGRMHVLWRG